MSKTYIIYLFLLTVNINPIFSQSFNIPGEVAVDGEYKRGFFSEELNEYTNSLSFKFSDSEEVINLYNTENIVFKINSKQYLYKTLNADGYIHPLIVLVNGKSSFYKDMKSENYYLQNESKKTKIVSLENFKNPQSNNRNIGILSVVFGDCISLRSRIEKETINESTLIRLTNNYNNCSEYSEGFELSSKQKREQEYLKQKNIYSLHIGASLAYNNFTSQIPAFLIESSKSNAVSYSAFLSLNVSPAYFDQLRDKFYFDISIAYISTPEFETEYYDIKRSNILVNISPTYYFSPNKKLRPFARANFGINTTNYDLKKNQPAVFSDTKGTLNSFIFGVEAGIQFNKKVEVALLYQPKSREKYPILFSNDFELDNNVIALKASYIFNLSKD